MSAGSETGTVEERIERALDMCRPFLHADGGDVQLSIVREGGVVELHFRGTCAICPMSLLTLRAGIERTVLRMVPEINRVESV